MKKQIIAGLFISILLAPIASFADSYDGPYCYEDLKNWEKYAAPDKNSQKYKDAEQWQKDEFDMDRERDKVRGTCKKVEQNNLVTLDDSISNDYLLAEHDGLDVGECYKGCESTIYSEGIDFATSSNLYIKQGQGSHWQGAVLLDKKFTMDFINSAYISAGKTKPTTLPYLVILNREEIKKYSPPASDFLIDYAKIMGDKQILIDGGKLYTYKDKDFSTHIVGIENKSGDYNLSPKELKYANVGDAKRLPNIGFVDDGGKNTESTMGLVSITSPVKSFTNYWKFTKENNNIALKWVKTEYRLDDGSTKVAMPGDKSTIDKIIGKITNSTTSSEHNTNISNSTSSNLVIGTSTDVRGDPKLTTEGPHNLSDFIKVMWIMLTSIFK